MGGTCHGLSILSYNYFSMNETLRPGASRQWEKRAKASHYPMNEIWRPGASGHANLTHLGEGGHWGGLALSDPPPLTVEII